MEGTRGPATRSRCGGMALTVSQSGRIAKRSRLALRRASPRGLRQPADLATSERRPPAPRRVHHRRAPLRAARQQANAAGARALRAVPPPRARALGPRERRRGARADRLAGVPTRTAPPRRAPAAARPALRARRRDDLRRRRCADRLVSPEPAKHVHGQAHAADAAADLHDRAPPAGAGATGHSTRSAGRRGRSVTVSVSSRLWPSRTIVTLTR